MSTAIAPPVLRPGQTRATGRHVDNSATATEADYADQLRRSSGWTPMHRASVETIGATA
jgi:arylamine N-acetyltransferase